MTMTKAQALGHVGAQLAIRTAEIIELAKTVPTVRLTLSADIDKNYAAAQALGCLDEYQAATATLQMQDTD